MCKTGPKPAPFLEGFILKLAEIFKQATGDKANPGYYDRTEELIKGVFPLFVVSVLDKIDKNTYQSSRSIVEYLKKILPKQ